MDVQQAKECGPVRAMRLKRDLGITTLESLANASVADLVEIWSVGVWTAKVMKGSAQGRMKEIRSNRPKGRIFVSAPDIVPQEVPRKSVRNYLVDTIEAHGYDVESDELLVGFPEATKTIQGHSLRDFMMEWSMRRDNIQLYGFDVHFDEHETPAGAFQDRRDRALNWATEVAIPVDNQYTGLMIHRATERELDVTVGLRRFEDHGEVRWDTESDVQQIDAIVEKPVGHDATDRPTSADAKWDANTNTTKVLDRHWDLGHTPGREGDLADPVDQYLSLEPNDQDEPRLDRNDLEGADPGGDGEPSSGKKSWSTGE